MCYGSIEEIADVSFNEVLGPNKPQGRTRFYENLTHPVPKISYTQRRPRIEFIVWLTKKDNSAFTIVSVFEEKKYLNIYDFINPTLKKHCHQLFLPLVQIRHGHLSG